MVSEREITLLFMTFSPLFLLGNVEIRPDLPWVLTIPVRDGIFLLNDENLSVLRIIAGLGLIIGTSEQF